MVFPLNPKFGDQVQAAANLGIPCIALNKISADPYLEISQASYPDPNDDFHFKLFDRLVYYTGMNGKKYARNFQGLLFDGRDPDGSDGRETTQGNWSNVLRYIYDSAWVQVPSHGIFDYQPGLDRSIPN